MGVKYQFSLITLLNSSKFWALLSPQIEKIKRQKILSNIA